MLLSLADNWKFGGGVDQYVDWSPTTPDRGADHPRPPDEEGDTDNTVGRSACSCIPTDLESRSFVEVFQVAQHMYASVLKRVDPSMQKVDPRQQEYEAERHALFFTDPNCREFYKVSDAVRLRILLTQQLCCNMSTSLS